jgi:hypothetical protein
LAVGVQQSDMVSVNLSARSNHYLYTDLRRFESHYICFVQHPQTHKAFTQCIIPCRSLIWDNQQHVILEELALLTFVIHLRELLAVRRGGVVRTPIMYLKPVETYF